MQPNNINVTLLFQDDRPSITLSVSPTLSVTDFISHVRDAVGQGNNFSPLFAGRRLTPSNDPISSVGIIDGASVHIVRTNAFDIQNVGDRFRGILPFGTRPTPNTAGANSILFSTGGVSDYFEFAVGWTSHVALPARRARMAEAKHAASTLGDYDFSGPFLRNDLALQTVIARAYVREGVRPVLLADGRRAIPDETWSHWTKVLADSARAESREPTDSVADVHIDPSDLACMPVHEQQDQQIMQPFPPITSTMTSISTDGNKLAKSMEIGYYIAYSLLVLFYPLAAMPGILMVVYHDIPILKVIITVALIVSVLFMFTNF